MLAKLRVWVARHSSWAPALMVWLAGLLWVLIEALGRALGTRYSPFEVVWVRYAVHLLILVIAVAPRRKLALVRPRQPLLQVARGLLMLGMPLCFVLAASRLEHGQVWAVFWIAPLLALAVEPRVLGGDVRVRTWLIVALGYLATLLVSASLPAARWAAPLPIGMAVCFGLYLILSRKLRDEALSTSLLFTGLGVVVPLTLAMPYVWRTPDLMDGLVMAAIGVCGLAFLGLLDLALEIAPISDLAPHLYAQPVLLVAFNTLALREPLNASSLVGAVLVACALIALCRRPASSSAQTV